MSTLREKWRALRGDGCTNAPDLTYHSCCRDHDRRYYFHADADGRALERSQADAMLYDCMKRHGKIPLIGTHLVPALYWAAVRIFGGKHWEHSP